MKDLYLIGALPGWAIAAVAAAAAALLVYQFFGLRQRLTGVQSALLALLRLCVYAVLIFFLFGPALIDERVTRLRRPLTVLIDSSESMSFPAAAQAAQSAQPEKSRLDAVREKLSGGNASLIQRLNREYDLQIFRLGTALEPIAADSLAQLKAQDRGSRIIELLQSAAKEADGQSGILLFSDGIANGEKKTLDPASPPLPVPVFTVAVGDTAGFTDARIAEVRAPEFAFRGREFKVDVVVQAAGLKGSTLPLYFNRGKNLITSRSVAVDADPFERIITLTFTPKELGTHGFSVTIPPQPAEQISRNNQKEFKVDVQRDKIRVLTLSGSPAWNYRFLRMAMKQDPLIELVSFVFLRTPTDSVDVPDNRLSLIPFPIDDIFLEELKNFDVVLFDDFSHRAYFNPVYLEKVRDFVQDGGGLAVFGGSRAFDSGGYGDSALRDVLPVELDGKGNYQSQGDVRAVLTPAGKAHPITRLLPDPRRNEETWKKMPPLTSLNEVRGARGETLLTAGAGAAGAPLLTVGRFGKGRTLAFMSDDAWRWNFIAVGERESPQNHLKFIRQATRWLAQEPSFEQVQIRPIGASRPGEALRIKLRVLKDDFTPARGAAVQLRVIGPEGDTALIATSADSEEGEYSGEYTPTREGAYRVEAEATLSGKTLGHDRTSFSTAYAYGEAEDGRPRPDLLKQLAEKSGGDFFSIASFDEKALDAMAAKLETRAPSQIVERRQTRLWSTLWPFSIVLALLSVEWWMRRKWGMI
jgi:uncharacterized membrane protein